MRSFKTFLWLNKGKNLMISISRITILRGTNRKMLLTLLFIPMGLPGGIPARQALVWLSLTSIIIFLRKYANLSVSLLIFKPTIHSFVMQRNYALPIKPER